MKHVRPVMLLGLGEAGTIGVKTISDQLLQSMPDLAPMVACVTLGKDGVLRDTSDGSERTLKGFKNEFSEGIFQANYKAAIAASDAVSSFLSERFGRLLRQDGRMSLEDRGYSVDSCISLMVISDLSDPIGSSCVTPVLATIQELLSGRMRGAEIESFIIGFLPDVFPESRALPDAYGRAYTCIQEFEFIAENPTVVGVEGNPPFNNAFLFSSRNEDGIEIASAEELLVMAGEFLSNLLRGDIASDASYSLALTREVEGKRTRYSSFGLAKLVFPVNEVMKAIAGRYEVDYIGQSLGEKTPQYNADLLSADVKEFVGGTALDRLPEAMRTNESGKTLYSEFQYSGSVNEKVNVDSFIASLGEESEGFERTTGVEMSKSLAKRRDGLLTEHLDRLGSHINVAMDDSGKGVFYASAFVDVLRDGPSAYVRDDGTLERYSLSVVEANAKRFFDNTFGIDRTGLSKVKRDLEDKNNLLAKRKVEAANSAGDKQRSPSDGTTEQAVRGSIDDLEGEIAILEQRRRQLETQVTEFDLKLADPAKRRDLLDVLLGNEAEERSKKQKELMAADTNLQDALSALEDLYSQRRTFVMKLVLLFPMLIAFATGAVSALRGRLQGISIIESLNWGLGVLPSVLALYAVVALIAYFTRMHGLVKAAELAVEKRKGEKRLALLALQNAYKKHFQTRFEHELFSGLIGWIADYKSYAASLSASLAEFIAALRTEKEKIDTELDQLKFPNSPLVRSAVTKDDVDTIISSNPEATHEAASFRKVNGLADFFTGFLDDRNLGKLHSAIDAFAESVFASIRKDSIEQVLVRTLGSGPRLSTRLSQLYQSSKAFIQLSVNQGEDVSQSLVYVGTQTDEKAVCRELLTRIGGPGTSFYSTGDQYQLTAARMKVGFPAYHVALMRYGRTIAEKATPKRFTVDPDWEMDDLIPSLYVAGGADDAARILLCLGRAFGLITYDRAEGFAFEGASFGKTIETAVAELRKASQGNARNQLSYRIEAAKVAPNAVDQLAKFRNVAKGDPVDLEILNRFMTELSPLA